MKLSVALYARVSSAKQVQENTIDSQMSALLSRIELDGFACPSEMQFVDAGYSGSILVRPALEKMRDIVAAKGVNKIYVHSPDRLARKYAYQTLLIEEFAKSNVEVVFLNARFDDNPESNLLLQMQGMIAEYERAKILERNRRGRLHAAKNGSINVLAQAPYGYRRVNKHIAGGQAYWEVHEEEAETIRKIFYWVGQKWFSIGEVCRLLDIAGKPSPKKKAHWDRSTIYRILRNPAYKGQAGFGKRKIVSRGVVA